MGSMTDFRAETTAAIAGVQTALRLARGGPEEVRTKVGRDVVTDTDFAVEDHLRQSLTGSSGWPVIGEERGGEVPNGVPYWVVDPICGTRNFASGIPLFAINAALVEDGRVTVSVVGDGSTGDVLAAEVGKGAWRVWGGGKAGLTASDSSLMVDFGAWPKSELERRKAARTVARAISLDRWDVRCFATTLSLAQVATGQVAGCVLFAASDLVHIAAGTLLVSEAGGRVTDAGGEAWTLGARSLVCTANKQFHGCVLELLRANRSR
jgi:myo-inositol-1(or 4)-monophosphatase